MNLSSWKNERLMVPRWRSLAVTLRSKELASTGQPRGNGVKGSRSSELVDRLQRWRLSPGLVTAAELVATALVDGRESEGVDAATRLLTVDTTAAPLIRDQAAILLRRAGHGDISTDAASNPVQKAAYFRHLTRVHPTDALAWVELAFQQTVRGHIDAAERSMCFALHFAPDNRHVLRSATRLYLHRKEPDRAHDLLLRSNATKQDPWLLSAEIALARCAQRDPRFFKTGLRMVEDGGLAPRHVTELAGSVATADLLDGSRKRARKLFVQSMRDPNGNALAQGEWATPRLGGTEFVSTDQLQSTNEAFEAKAFHEYRLFNFEGVPPLCELWAEADPYTVQPFEFGATAASYAEQFDKAVDLAKRGLKLQPKSPVLLNKLAYALSSMGMPLEAQKILKSISLPDENTPLFYLMAANRGHCALRQGKSEEGLKAYRVSIEGFRRLGNQQLSASAKVNLAREAKLAGIAEAPKLLSEAIDAMKPFPHSECAVLLDRIVASGRNDDTKPNTEEEKRRARLRSVRWSSPNFPGPQKLVF